MPAALPRTANGRATRERILAAATGLIIERGVAAVSLDDIRERSATSKSQLYLYFDSREALLRAVVSRTGDLVIGGQQEHLGTPLDSFDRIEAWFDSMVAYKESIQARGGCPLGSLAGQLAEQDDGAREAIAASFDAWQAPLADGLRAMQARGELRPGADVDAMVTATMAAIQGGLLLAQVRRDPAQLRMTLDAALANLRS